MKSLCASDTLARLPRAAWVGLYKYLPQVIWWPEWSQSWLRERLPPPRMAPLSGSMISGSQTTEKLPWAQCQKVITKRNSNFSNNSFCLLPKKKKRMIIKRHHREVLGSRSITISRRGGTRGTHPSYGHVHTLIYDQVGWRITAL